MGLLGFKTFRHGVHPPESKDATAGLSIRQFPFAPTLIVPLVQHLGKPSIAEVVEGQEVIRGQRIARADGFVSVSMHAPASGVVRKIELTPSITGRMVPAVFIEPFPGSTQEVSEGTPCPVETATPDEIIAAIQDAGVVGLGGAAFPTHVKLKIPDGKYADTLIINGVECEPYLTTDQHVMLEQRDHIFMGIRYVMKVTGAERVIIGVEANKPDAAKHLRDGIPEDLPVTVEVLPVKYPQGAEKMLITALLGREVPSGGLPLDVHALCVNVATTAEIGRLLPHGRGIQERVITISGPAIHEKGNYRIPIGTPVRFALEHVGVADDVNRVFLGGPMMGAAVSNLDIVITKGTSGIVAFNEVAAERTHSKEYPCIRCGYCVEACPIFLNPSQLGVFALNQEYERMAAELNLMDCFECGSCTFVCPSHIPLVQRFRVAKGAVRKAKAIQAAEEKKEAAAAAAKEGAQTSAAAGAGSSAGGGSTKESKGAAKAAPSGGGAGAAAPRPKPDVPAVKVDGTAATVDPTGARDSRRAVEATEPEMAGPHRGDPQASGLRVDEDRVPEGAFGTSRGDGASSGASGGSSVDGGGESSNRAGGCRGDGSGAPADGSGASSGSDGKDRDGARRSGGGKPDGKRPAGKS